MAARTSANAAFRKAFPLVAYTVRRPPESDSDWAAARLSHRWNSKAAAPNAARDTSRGLYTCASVRHELR
jgi:hypothetical protein